MGRQRRTKGQWFEGQFCDGGRRSGRFAILVALASVRTVSYARHWNDALGFYRYAQQQQPKSSMLYLLLAGEFMSHGDDAAADATYAAARAACPDSWNVWMTAAQFALRQGRLDEADRMARQAFKLRPGVMTAMAVLEEIDNRRATTKPTISPATVPATAP